MLEGRRQYFLGIVPPSPVFERAAELKRYVSEQFRTRAAMRSPPHITLHMPFAWREDREGVLIDGLTDFATGQRPFPVQLHGFGAFRPKVIYIHVVAEERLKAFQGDLERFCRRKFNLLNANHDERPYVPHLTLAFRDLRKQQFSAAWEEFSDKPFDADFVADRFVLLRHEGGEWHVYHEFPLAD